MFSFILITIVGICGFAALLEAAVKAVLETGLKTVQLNVCSVRALDKSRLKTGLCATDEETSYSYAEEDVAAGGGRLLFPGDQKEGEGMEIASDGKLQHNEEDVTEESKVVEKRSEVICEFEEQQQCGLLKTAKEQQQSGLLVTAEKQQQSGLLFAAEQQQSGLLVTAEEQQQSGLSFAAEQQQSGLLLDAEEQLQCRLPDAAEEKNDNSVIFGHAVHEDIDAEEVHRLKTEETVVTAPRQNSSQQNKVSIKMTVKKEMLCPLGARASYLREKYGVAIWIPREEDSSEMVEFYGDLESVLKVQTTISQMLDTFSCRRKLILEICTCKFERICGYEGEIIKWLRGEFDLSIYVPSKMKVSRKLPNEICKVRILGHRDKVDRVLEMIGRLIGSENEEMDVKSGPSRALTEQPKEQVGLKIPLSRKDHPEDVVTATKGCKEEEDLAEKDFSRNDCEPKEEWTTYTSLGRHHTGIYAQKIEVPEEPIDQEDQDTILGTLETARVVDDVPTAQAMTKSPATEKEYIDWWNYSSDED